jgi:hypothetical protein
MTTGRGAVIASAVVVTALITGMAWHRSEEPVRPTSKMDRTTLLKLLAGPDGRTPREILFADYVLQDGARLHALPSASSRIVKREVRGARILVYPGSGLWWKVRDSDIEGWMRNDEIGPDPP